MSGGTRCQVYSYVDDYLDLLDKSGYQGRVENILNVLREKAHGLKSTVELMSNRELQFLDLRLPFGDG